MKQYLTTFIANAKKSPKTTALGIAGVVGSITAAVHNPALLGNAAWWTPFLVSVGLLFSGDAGGATA